MHLTSRESYPAQIDTRPSSTRIDFISVYYAFCCSIFLLFKIKLREPAIEEGKTKRRKTLSRGRKISSSLPASPWAYTLGNYLTGPLCLRLSCLSKITFLILQRPAVYPGEFSRISFDNCETDRSAYFWPFFHHRF